MTTYRAIVFDIDGTLLDREQRLHDDHRDPVLRCEAAGMAVLLATARYHGSAVSVLGAMGRLARRGVFAAGPMAHCQVSDWSWRRSIPAATVDALCTAIGEHLPWCGLSVATADGALAFEPEVGSELRRVWGVGDLVAEPLVSARRRDALRVSVFSERPDARLAEIVPLLQRLGHGRCRVIAADRGQSLYITPVGVDKGVGTLALLAHLGIAPAEAIACGDDVTDLPLLAAVGAGIAMSDGHADLLAMTAHHARPSAEGGLADCVERLMGWR